MSTTRIAARASRVRFGHARTDITPPVGIYHRLWGAARHDRATGVHRPLFGDVMVFAACEGSAPLLIRVLLDLAGLAQHQHDELRQALAEAGGVPRDNVVITYSHTHSSGWFVPDRIPLPGGELILPYLEQLGRKLRAVCGHALANVQEVTITYASGRCNLAANRDYWDSENGGYACGFNPDAESDDTLVVARVTDAADRLVGTIVNYACHPTTLAWENSLISPDYIGAMRQTVEGVTGAPSVFVQGACGDLGPRHGFVGDTAIADRNGRQLGYAALSVLETMGPPRTDFQYDGPVVSGATLGAWSYNHPFSRERLDEISWVDGGTYAVDLPLKPRPDRAALRAELDEWEARKREADARGDARAARDYGARAERSRRWLGRLDDLPEGTRTTIPLRFSVHRVGDAVWIACGGEPYNRAQVELRRRFPDRTIILSPLGSDLQVAYLLPRDRYGKGLYQEEPSILAPGCLETLIDAIAARVEEHGGRTSRQ